MTVPASTTVFDCDSHLFEYRSLWLDHLPVADHHLALRIVDDDLGYPTLRFGEDGAADFLCWVSDPSDPEIGSIEQWTKGFRSRTPAPRSYDEFPDAAYWDPGARVARLDDWGIDKMVTFPQWGLSFERVIGGDIDGQHLNMSAWNRWAVTVASVGGGRLYPAGHVSLQGDDVWLETELAALAEGGVRLAIATPGLSNGRRLSHPDLDRVWSMFEHFDIALIWHTSNGEPTSVAPAWFGDEGPIYISAVESPFKAVPVQLCLTDMTLNGVFEAHPRMRVGVAEFFPSGWLPAFLDKLDRAPRLHRVFNGYERRPSLSLAPSDYIRRQVRFTVFAHEDPELMARRAGDVFAYGGDYPHAEGLASPYHDFVELAGSTSTAGLFGRNASFLTGV